MLSAIDVRVTVAEAQGGAHWQEGNSCAVLSACALLYGLLWVLLSNKILRRPAFGQAATYGHLLVL